MRALSLELGNYVFFTRCHYLKRILFSWIQLFFVRSIRKIFPPLPVYASDRDWIEAQLLISWNYVTSPSLRFTRSCKKKNLIIQSNESIFSKSCSVRYKYFFCPKYILRSWCFSYYNAHYCYMLLLLLIRCKGVCNRSVDDLLIWIKNGYDGSVRPNATGKDCQVMLLNVKCWILDARCRMPIDDLEVQKYRTSGWIAHV